MDVSCLPNIQFFLTPNRGLKLPTPVTIVTVVTN